MGVRVKGKPRIPKTRDYADDYALIAIAQQNGDAGREAMDRLVRKHWGFLHDLTKKCTPRHMDYEELVADAVIVFMRCVRKFRLDSGLSILTLAHIAINRELPRHVARNHVIKSIVPLSGVTAERKEASLRARRTRMVGDRGWMYDGAAKAKDHARDEMLTAARLCLDELPEREREILHDRLRGRTLREIADDMGLSYERVRQIEEHALRRCRGVLGSMVGAA